MLSSSHKNIHETCLKIVTFIENMHYMILCENMNMLKVKRIVLNLCEFLKVKSNHGKF
jgi:hypothetical protein